MIVSGDASRVKPVMHADNPPAYSADALSSGSASNRFPPATVDQVHIFTNHENIKGTFYIDPHVPSLRRNRKRKSQQVPHASFRSRKGDISIDLGTTGDLSSAKKANVEVATDKGDVKINLLPTPDRPLGLDVSSRKGDIVVFLPKTFTGVVHLLTKKGDMVVLPALASIMNVVKSSEKEVILMIVPGNTTDNSGETTLCQVNARKGTIVVGLSGQDQYESQPSFWKKLGSYLNTQR